MAENPAHDTDDVAEELLAGAEGLDSAETGIGGDAPIDPPAARLTLDERELAFVKL
jgi:hypothetical protein